VLRIGPGPRQHNTRRVSWVGRSAGVRTGGSGAGVCSGWWCWH